MKNFVKNLLGKKTQSPKNNNVEETFSISDEVVQWLAAHAPDDWQKSILAAKVFDDSRHMTFFYLVGAENRKKFISLAMEEKAPIIDKLKIMKELAITRGDNWTCCRFILSNQGKYEVQYMYEDIPLKEVADGYNENT